MSAGKPREDSLKNAIAAARGRLDADFRRGNYFQASLDAADVSKLAYALYYVQSGGDTEGGNDESD